MPPEDASAECEAEWETMTKDNPNANSGGEEDVIPKRKLTETAAPKLRGELTHFPGKYRLEGVGDLCTAIVTDNWCDRWHGAVRWGAVVVLYLVLWCFTGI